MRVPFEKKSVDTGFAPINKVLKAVPTLDLEYGKGWIKAAGKKL